MKVGEVGMFMSHAYWRDKPHLPKGREKDIAQIPLRPAFCLLSFGRSDPIMKDAYHLVYAHRVRFPEQLKDLIYDSVAISGSLNGIRIPRRVAFRGVLCGYRGGTSGRDL